MNISFLENAWTYFVSDMMSNPVVLLTHWNTNWENEGSIVACSHGLDAEVVELSYSDYTQAFLKLLLSRSSIVVF